MHLEHGLGESNLSRPKECHFGHHDTTHAQIERLVFLSVPRITLASPCGRHLWTAEEEKRVSTQRKSLPSSSLHILIMYENAWKCPS